MKRYDGVRRVALAMLLAAVLPAAQPAWAERPRLALVIDDIGWDLDTGRRVLSLPGTLTIAVLPRTPAGIRLAVEAHETGREVILHQPMTAERVQNAGPGNLLPEMGQTAIAAMLAENLEHVPHHRGVSNHMGSLLTRNETSMRAVMAELSLRGLYFLDSRTTPLTVALSSARSARVPSVRRDVFLDNVLDGPAIRQALERAVRLAERRGHAVAIGHPHTITLDVLEAQLPQILQRVELVLVSELVTVDEPSRPALGLSE